MAQNPPEGYSRVIPYLLYEDTGAAVDWLTRTFGFRERMRMPDESGRVTHAEIELGDGVVMLGTPGGDYRSPKRLGAKTQFVYVYVDDVDEHFARARDAGATIIRELSDQSYGDRNYGAEDLEGHEWYFGQHVRDVSPEELGATEAEGAGVQG